MARSSLKWRIKSEDEPEGCMMGLIHMFSFRPGHENSRNKLLKHFNKRHKSSYVSVYLSSSEFRFKQQEQHNERVPFNLSLKKFIRSLRHSTGDNSINKWFKTNDAEKFKKRTLGYFLYEESCLDDENETMVIKKKSKTLADMFYLSEWKSPEEESMQMKDNQESSVDESRVLKELHEVDEHVRFVLEASGINYNEISDRLLRRSCQMLEPILLEEIELSNKPLGEQKLLFDCINEVLVEIDSMQFRCSSNPRLISIGRNFIQKVFEGIVPHLNLEFPSTLEKLVTKDLDKTWRNLTSETQNFVCDLGDDILVALIDEFISVITLD